MDDSASQGDFYNVPEESKKSSRKNPFFILVIIMILGIIGFGAYTFLVGSSDEKTSEENITPTPTVAPTPTLEPNPTPETSITPTKKVTPTIKATSTPTKSPVETIDKTTGLDRADLTVEVLNGSGTAGIAGKMKATLEGLGYKVSSTGNADSFEYNSTTIEVKAVKKNFLDLLKKDLSGSYTIGTTSATFSGSADARVIVGKQ